MAKPKKPSDDDILPPEDERAHENLSSTEKAARATGARLRMPPLIDHADGDAGMRAGKWLGDRFHDWRDRATHAAQDAQGRSLHVLRRGVYHLTLWSLVGATLVVTFYGIWQARHMQVPSLDGFWFNADFAARVPGSERGDDLIPSVQPKTDAPKSGSEIAAVRPMAAQDRPAIAAKPAPIDDGAGDDGIGDDGPGAAHNDLAELNDALRREIETAQQTETELRRQMAALETRLTALKDKADKTDQAALLSRAAMADLVLRLEAGLPYDDILAAGHLENVLTRREWALLGLHADTGLPTRAALTLQFETWLDSLDAAAATDAAATDRSFRRFMDWLNAHAGDLLSVKPTPLALADDRLTAIHGALRAAQYDEATLYMGGLLRRFDMQETAPLGQSPAGLRAMTVLQALYDETRTVAELAPLMARLKRDYLSGARP